jgi:hypothetical protein
LTVGGAFLVLAALFWYRHFDAATIAVGALGGALTLGGLLVPTRLGPVERGWMALAHAISRVTTPIVMGAMYLLVLTPVGALRRMVGSNPLVHRPGAHGYWRERPSGRRRSRSMQQQF